MISSSTSSEKEDVTVHLGRLREVLQVMRENELCANLKKCVFCAPEIRVVGCCVGSGVCADPEKVPSICSRPTPRDQK